MRQTRAHDCQIKELLYPEKKKSSKNFLSSNYRQIKLIQEQNRLKKQKLEAYVERNYIIILIFLKLFII
jgi:hypothetical protein